MWNKKSLCVIAAFTLTLAAGCGGGGGGEKAPASHSSSSGAAATGGATAGASGMGTATIAGTVSLTGAAPSPKKLSMSADPKCEMKNPDAVSNDYVVNDGKLKWVFVYVEKGISGTYPTPTEPVVLDQVGCRYQPHMFGIMVDQPLKIKNSDETLHNIHSLAKNSRQFNIAMPRVMELPDQKFKAEELMVRIKCDVHPWMETWAGVLPHPFFSVTDDQGHFSIGKLPAGTYTVTAWHEELGATSQEVTVADDESKDIAFAFSM